MLKVYIAAPYPTREDAIAIMRGLEVGHGINVTSRWLKAPDELADEHARKDLEDVAAADILLALHPAGWEDKGTGGRHVELGYALALGKAVVLVGEKSNIFHYLSDLSVLPAESDVSTIAAALRAVESPYGMTLSRAVALIVAEVVRAERKHKPFNSHHEGYAVIQEEVDELWDDVKADRKDHAFVEAVQVAAMGLRFILNLSGKHTSLLPSKVA